MKDILLKFRTRSIALLVVMLCGITNAMSLNAVVKLRMGDCKKCYSALEQITLNQSLKKVLLVTDREKGSVLDYLKGSKFIPDTINVSNQMYLAMSQRVDSEFLITNNDYTEIYFSCGLADLPLYLDEVEQVVNPSFSSGKLFQKLTLQEATPHAHKANEIYLINKKGDNVQKVLLSSNTATKIYAINHSKYINLYDSSWIHKLQHLFGSEFDYLANDLTYMEFYKNEATSIEPMFQYSHHRFCDDKTLVFYRVNEIQRRVSGEVTNYRYRNHHTLMFVFNDSTLIGEPYYIPEKPQKNNFILGSELYYFQNRFVVGLQKNITWLPWGNKILGEFPMDQHVVTKIDKLKVKKPKEYSKTSKKMGFDFTLLELSSDSNLLLNYSGHHTSLPNNDSNLKGLDKLHKPFDQQFIDNYANFKLDQIPYYTNLTSVKGGVLVIRTLNNNIDVLFYDNHLNQVTGEYRLGSYLSNSIPCAVKRTDSSVRFVYVDYQTNTLKYVDFEGR